MVSIYMEASLSPSSPRSQSLPHTDAWVATQGGFSKTFTQPLTMGSPPHPHPTQTYSSFSYAFHSALSFCFCVCIFSHLTPATPPYTHTHTHTHSVSIQMTTSLKFQSHFLSSLSLTLYILRLSYTLLLNITIPIDTFLVYRVYCLSSGLF